MYLPYYGSSVRYPTNFLKNTTFCVADNTSLAGRVKPWSTHCIQRYWGGVPIIATDDTNVGVSVVAF